MAVPPCFAFQPSSREVHRSPATARVRRSGPGAAGLMTRVSRGISPRRCLPSISGIGELLAYIGEPKFPFSCGQATVQAKDGLTHRRLEITGQGMSDRRFFSSVTGFLVTGGYCLCWLVTG